MWKTIKGFLASQLVKIYAGSIVRGALRFISGVLVAHGLATKDVAAALEGSAYLVTMNLIELIVTNPEALTGAAIALGSQIWSMVEKTKKNKELKAVEEKANG